MDELVLELNQKPLELVPNQTINGRAGWRMTTAPGKASLRLFWYTEGRGNQDVGIVAEEDVHSPLPNNETTFEFQIPAQPYSFAGKLIALRWALELVVDGGEHVKRVDLMVSPWVEQATLKSMESEKSEAFSKATGITFE